MKLPFVVSTLTGCAAAVLTFSACANQPNTTAKHGASTTGAARLGTIPTRDGRNSQSVAGNPVGGANGEEYRVPTGSNLPRAYNRRGYTTDNPDPEEVYDDNDIRLRSTNNVGDALRSIPGVRVSGPP